MSLNFSDIKWGWVILGVILALAVAYGASFCVVTGYASFLGFQAQGAPDTAAINTFATDNAPWISSIAIAIGTLAGGYLAGRKSETNALTSGLMVGVITAVIDLLISITGGLSVWGILSVVLAVAGGWLGGRISSR